jgi:hypothetical protein
MVAHAHKTRLLVLLEGDGLVLALAGPPEEEGNAEGGKGHHSEGGPVQLKDKNACYIGTYFLQIRKTFMNASKAGTKAIFRGRKFLQTQRLLQLTGKICARHKK